MPLPDLGQFVRGVTVACSDLAQILARHAVQSVDCVAMLARCHQQVVERRPVVSPVEIEANTLLQFFGVNLTAPPFIEDVLVAGENCFQAQYYGTVSRLCTIFKQSRGKAL